MRKGEPAEDYILSLLQKAIPGLTKTSNSGAAQGNADLGDKNWMVEVKSTEAASFPLKRLLIRSVELKAEELGKNPILAVVTNSKNPTLQHGFVVLPLEFAQELLAHYERSFYGQKENTTSGPHSCPDCGTGHYYGTTAFTHRDQLCDVCDCYPCQC